ncbi:hypothetical protein RFI_08071 [Reticulomyxa filosa]|uniref:C2H2-type domain-containing protein n=1 Tax=Reticulomyxa filosa TaxID=46433 RepID=X6NTH6_RETFI|nr:hypothetical protein RFI_08071 [Reticulomyxa filosa]|eukprot:ETO29054.1 hypothetical protein RFI_08071 [Reticulomyxa filosa]
MAKIKEETQAFQCEKHYFLNRKLCLKLLPDPFEQKRWSDMGEHSPATETKSDNISHDKDTDTTSQEELGKKSELLREGDEKMEMMDDGGSGSDSEDDTAQFGPRLTYDDNGEMIFRPLRMKCTHCDESFSKTHDLYRHIRSHQNHTKCPFCQKTLTCMATFVYHVRTHTGEKPYYCPVENCHFKNAVKYNLKKCAHVHTHKKKQSQKKKQLKFFFGCFGKINLKKYAKVLDLDVCERSLKKRKDDSVHELGSRCIKKRRKMPSDSQDSIKGEYEMAAELLMEKELIKKKITFFFFFFALEDAATGWPCVPPDISYLNGHNPNYVNYYAGNPGAMIENGSGFQPSFFFSPVLAFENANNGNFAPDYSYPHFQYKQTDEEGKIGDNCVKNESKRASGKKLQEDNNTPFAPNKDSEQQYYNVDSGYPTVVGNGSNNNNSNSNNNNNNNNNTSGGGADLCQGQQNNELYYHAVAGGGGGGGGDYTTPPNFVQAYNMAGMSNNEDYYHAAIALNAGDGNNMCIQYENMSPYVVFDNYYSHYPGNNYAYYSTLPGSSTTSNAIAPPNTMSATTTTFFKNVKKALHPKGKEKEKYSEEMPGDVLSAQTSQKNKPQLQEGENHGNEETTNCLNINDTALMYNPSLLTLLFFFSLFFLFLFFFILLPNPIAILLVCWGEMIRIFFGLLSFFSFD